MGGKRVKKNIYCKGIRGGKIMKAVNWARDVYQRLVHIEDKEGLILETLRRGGGKK